MKRPRAAPVGVVLEGAVAVGAGGVAEADGIACLVHIVVEVPGAAEDDGGFEGGVVAVEGEVGIVLGEFGNASGKADSGEEEDAGHGEWEVQGLGPPVRANGRRAW